MGLFDSYFDPEQFQDSGGLLGRRSRCSPCKGSISPVTAWIHRLRRPRKHRPCRRRRHLCRLNRPRRLLA